MGIEAYYLFKLKKSARVLEAVRAVSEEQWQGAASFGSMQVTEVSLQLTTWAKPRRIIIDWTKMIEDFAPLKIPDLSTVNCGN
jgi:hypothetical protein